MRRIATVRTAKKKKTMDRRKNPPRLLVERPMCITMDHNTSDNSAYRKRKHTDFFTAVMRKVSVPLNKCVHIYTLIYELEIKGGLRVTYVHEPD